MLVEGRGPGWGRRVGVLGAVGLGVLCLAWVGFLSEVARHTRFGSSDNANALLAGREMVRGNVVLRGWVMPPDSYWLLDLPLLGLASLVFGTREILLGLVPAALAVGTVVVGTWVAGIGQTRERRWIAAGVLAIVVGLPHRFLAFFMLQGPHHGATTLCCLAAIGLLSTARIGSARWTAAVVLLAMAVLSDAIAVAIGVGPVVVAGAVDAVQRRRPAALAAPVGAAAAAMIGSVGLRGVVAATGGFRVEPTLNYFSLWRTNLRAAPQVLETLAGGGPGAGVSRASGLVHAGVGVLVAAAASATLAPILRGALRGIPAGGVPGGGASGADLGWWCDTALLVGAFAGVVAFAGLAPPGAARESARYLLPTLVFSAVLAARRVQELARRFPAWPVAAVGLAVGAVYLAAPVQAVRPAEPVNPSEAVAHWLERQHLDHGYGQYWVAGITTVTSEGRVVVRPVQPTVDGQRLQPDIGFASTRWFERDRHPFRFVVLQPADGGGVDADRSAATFGPPQQDQTVGPYRVLVWDHDLQPQLPPPTKGP